MCIYTQEIEVLEKHLDELNHVNNVIYLQWVQEVARAHWSSKVSSSILANYFWVVRSHHLEYRKQAFLGDKMAAKTYVVNFKGPLSERAVDFYRGEELIVEARSHWCLIETATQRPRRVPEEMKELFSIQT